MMHKINNVWIKRHNSNKRKGMLVLLTLATLFLFRDRAVAQGYLKGHVQHWTECGSCSQIGGIVWEDLDRDGIFEAGEPGLPGVRLRLLKFNEAIYGLFRSAVTNSEGYFLFVGLPPGCYKVEVDSSGAALTTPYNPLPPVCVTRQHITWANFGLALDIPKPQVAPPANTLPPTMSATLNSSGLDKSDVGDQKGTSPEGIPLPPETARKIEDLRTISPP